MIGDWLDIGPVTQISPGNARTLPVRGGPNGEDREIAVFHTLDNQFYALVNQCPHKHGPLSQGIVHGNVVTCPLHSWNISLKTGEALGDDKGCVPVIPLRVDAGRIYLLRSAVLGQTPSAQAA
ncbi:MAG: nitrite reductase small subunit NirD [Pseudomonadota bacterium]